MSLANIHMPNNYMSPAELIDFLPQQPPFRFVDEITQVDENSISGSYRFKEEEFFYKGHFPGNPVTPGVILTECMAQIGLVCFGIYLINDKKTIQETVSLFTHSDVEFLKTVRPGETVAVVAEKIYFRRNSLKCKVTMYNSSNENIATSTLKGMFVPLAKTK